MSAIEPTHDMYVLPNVLKFLPQTPSRILEVGCGNGFVAGRLRGLGHSIVGIDLWEEGIKAARDAYPEVRFEVASAYDDLTTVADGNVDVVLAIEVVEHLFSPRKFAENAFRVLRPGGRMILSTPYHGYLKNLALSLADRWDNHFTVHWEGGHIKFFSERSLSNLLTSSGFERPIFANTGRVPYLWKSMVLRTNRPFQQRRH